MDVCLVKLYLKHNEVKDFEPTEALVDVLINIIYTIFVQLLQF